MLINTVSGERKRANKVKGYKADVQNKQVQRSNTQWD